MTLPRIRQLVFASFDQDDIARLRHILDLGKGFVDPGVRVFGLTNGVFALGDQFLEVVVPTEENTAAGRFLDRTQGIGGYMAIFQTDDLAGVRSRADAAKIRRVWDIDVEDISASHLHPADIGAAIVSIDEAHPAASWRWGGPNWQKNAKPGGLRGVEISAIDPRGMAARWASILGVITSEVGHEVWSVPTADGALQFFPGDRDGMTSYTLAHPDPAGCLRRAQDLGCSAQETSFHFSGVKLYLVAD
ncbi:MAG: VOC family protein [Pseudomonadota bacterium]